MARQPFRSPEAERLQQQMITAPEPTPGEASPQQHMIEVHKTIHKAHQRITDGVPVRCPTDVLEFVEDRIYDKNDRITVLYHLLELGKEVMEERLRKGNVTIRYGRRDRGGE